MADCPKRRVPKKEVIRGPGLPALPIATKLAPSCEGGDIVYVPTVKKGVRFESKLGIDSSEIIKDSPVEFETI